MIDFNLEYERYLNVFNDYLKRKLNSLSNSAPKTITEAMRYSVENGGKRVRPVLCLATAEMLGINFTEVINYALALELIHSYSLVHDDLPAMDNDDYRRGKLSTHKKFGEANGILAGDALLNFAFEICLSKDKITSKDVQAIKIIVDCAGYNGMIAGQVLDLQSENVKELDKELLYKIYENKTAKLLIAPLLVACSFVHKKYYSLLNEYGYNLGILFQITDDILDVEGDVETIGKTPNKDSKSNKFTSIKLFGIDKVKKVANEHYEKCIELLSKIPNSDFLMIFTRNIYERKK